MFRNKRKLYTQSDQVYSKEISVNVFLFTSQWNIIGAYGVHIEQSFLNLVKSNQIWIVIWLFILIWHQTEFRLVCQIYRKKCNYNSNLVWFSMIQKSFICVHILIRTMYIKILIGFLYCIKLKWIWLFSIFSISFRTKHNSVWLQAE